ncbi:hypothetical protein, partial [Robbsia andropogonis]|uniref:hypothetical protein n=1 Tax=Robbsia andropogonis TaxID=28092 RepID=UPI0012F99B02
MSEAISEIVAAHNKCFDCDGGPCVMNCSGRASRISDATKGGEANPDAQSEAKSVQYAQADADAVKRVDIENQRLRHALFAMMRRLTELLDEAQFAEMDAIALSAGLQPDARVKPAESGNREGFDYWDRLCAIQPYSFSLHRGSVRRSADQSGNWIERSEAQRVMDDAQSEINSLRLAALAAQSEAKPVAW